MKWYKTLENYGVNQNDIDVDVDDPDLDLIPKIVEKVIAPKISGTL